MKTFKIDIHRHFYYYYEVLASNEEEAESKAFDDLKGETNDVKLLESDCYDEEAFDCEEVTK